MMISRNFPPLGGGRVPETYADCTYETEEELRQRKARENNQDEERHLTWIGKLMPQKVIEIPLSKLNIQ